MERVERNHAVGEGVDVHDPFFVCVVEISEVCHQINLEDVSKSREAVYGGGIPKNESCSCRASLTDRTVSVVFGEL